MNSKLIQGADPTIKVTTILKPSSTVFFIDNLLPDDTKVDSKQSRHGPRPAE